MTDGTYPRKAQLTAIRNHCRLAVETTHPRFAHIGPDKAYSVIVTRRCPDFGKLHPRLEGM